MRLYRRDKSHLYFNIILKYMYCVVNLHLNPHFATVGKCQFDGAINPITSRLQWECSIYSSVKSDSIAVYQSEQISQHPFWDVYLSNFIVSGVFCFNSFNSCKIS